MNTLLSRLIFGAIIIGAFVGITYFIFTGGTKFSPSPQEADVATSTEKVLLYYYNPTKDRDASGNILCSRQGLEAVERKLPSSEKIIDDTILLFLRGKLTEAERARGITTEYPLSGLSFKGTEVDGNTLTLRFEDPEHTTSGGSCRVQILYLSLESTAKQFPRIDAVKIFPEELFQP